MKSTKSDGNVIPWQTNLHVIGKKICKRRYQNSKIKVFSWIKYQVYENSVNLVIKIRCFFVFFLFKEIPFRNHRTEFRTKSTYRSNWFGELVFDSWLKQIFPAFEWTESLWSGSIALEQFLEKNRLYKCYVTPVYKKFFVFLYKI